LRQPRSNPAVPRVLHLLAFLVGALALVVMAGAVVADWYYDEGHLPPGGAAICVVSGVAWLAGVGLMIIGRAPRGIVALGVTPALLLAVWLGFLD
jgi:hypothetical protein